MHIYVGIYIVETNATTFTLHTLYYAHTVPCTPSYAHTMHMRHRWGPIHATLVQVSGPTGETLVVMLRMLLFDVLALIITNVQV